MPANNKDEDLSFVPCSLELLSNLQDKILSKLLKNLNVTLVAFRGSGKTSELKFLTQHFKSLNLYDKKHLFSYLDLRAFLENKDVALRECVTYLSTHHKAQLDYEISDKISDFLGLETVDIGNFLDLLHLITYKKDQFISLIIDNSYLIYNGGKSSEFLRTDLNSIRVSNPVKICFLFIADCEFDENPAGHLAQLSLPFFENIELGKDFLFDEKSGERLFKNYESWHNHVFNKDFKKKCIELSYGDPNTMRHLVTMALGDSTYEQKFLMEEDLKKLYQLSNPEYLNIRFQKIIKSLGQKSLDFLSGKSNKPTDFLIQTGLVKESSEAENGHTYLNPIFGFFVSQNKDVLLKLKVENAESSSLVRKSLSGQELVLFDLFEQKPEILIPKDALAKAVWGDRWEEKYSDWAIDKLISNLRKKMEDVSYPRYIKSFKGKGFKLT